MQVEPPPPISEDRSVAELARKRLAKGKQLNLRFSYLNARRTRGESRPLSEQPAFPDDTAEVINLNALHDPWVDLNIGQDIYKWAVVYENQRGVTLFSTPYYSRLGLLPHDPPPFTVPEADGRRDRQPQVSLHNYPLPDGTWRWVSTSWMVDMRNEGEVHYDGFEYNWFFRRHKWRPEPGVLSAGGWVRRRRWVRLMMRPARPTGVEQHVGEDDQNLSTATPVTRYSFIADNAALELETEKAMVWRGDLGDWERCHDLMVHLNGDGTKLDVWREWLGVSPQTQQRRVWTEDDNFIDSEGFQGSPVTRAPVVEGAQRESLA